MASSLNINDIITQVRKLDKEDQITLLQRLVLLLKRTEMTKEAAVRLSSLSGLGSEMWKNTDIDNYIDEERQW